MKPKWTLTISVEKAAMQIQIFMNTVKIITGSKQVKEVSIFELVAGNRVEMDFEFVVFLHSKDKEVVRLGKLGSLRGGGVSATSKSVVKNKTLYIFM
uniref:Uncharacterized protein n=1 Tax=Peronospora matthiolae TaxID=2874970 RepID=A0AAV1UZC8_9STRA